METTVRDTTGTPTRLLIEKDGLNPLWDVHRVRGTGLSRQTVKIGRIMRVTADDWYSEHGFGWDSHRTRKEALAHLVRNVPAE